VTATLALFIALGGGAYAVTKLAKNSVKSKQIKDGQVKKPDLAAGAVSGEKVAAGAIGADQLAPDAVTGAKIAAGAIGADDLSPTVRPRHFAYLGDVGSATETILDFDGYKISASCDSPGGVTRVTATMTFPEAGFVDQAVTIAEFTAPTPTPGATIVNRVPAPAPPAGLRVIEAQPNAGKTSVWSNRSTYSAQTHSSEIAASGIADDSAKTCSLAGSLTESG
jgi:hypothetical protein